ncbi:MAG: hypothetical protein H7067_20245 [Burkholderiales bacterium]|nr:hypothetical protein [Opitutaceae bacterium]
MHLYLHRLRANTPRPLLAAGCFRRGFISLLLLGLMVTLSGTRALAETLTLASALDQADLAVSTSGDASWFGQTRVSHDGISAAQSGAIMASKSTSMSVTITGVSKFSFRWKTASEKGRDYLRFYIDGREQSGALSGDREWQLRTFTVSDSTSHTLRWTYSKDANYTARIDAAWVDEFTILESVAVAEKRGRTLRGMGDSSEGQLGLGAVVEQTSPQKIAANSAKVFAGGAHSLFIKTDGSLWGMGRNLHGQLGNANVADQTTPIQIATGVTQAAAGRDHTLFIKTDGSLWAMGDNKYGQLGDNTLTARTTPAQIITGVTQVAAGAGHSLFIKTDGSLWAMGDNQYGQLGDGTTTNRIVPVQIASNVAKVAAGAFHTLFVKSDGALYAVGKNESGQLGDGGATNRSAPVQIATGALRVAAGEAHSLFIKTDGSLWVMGGNAYGQLGDDNTSDHPNPTKIATSASNLAAGANNTFFIKSDGSLWGMGLNENGQLGDGATDNRASPFRITTTVVDIAAGPLHTLFLQPSAVFTVTFNLGTQGTRTGGGTLVQSVGEGTAATAPTLQVKTGWVLKAWDASFVSVSSTMTVNAVYARSQSITFNTPPDQLFTTPGGGSVELAATASSGLPVKFEVVSGPATLAPNGTTLTYTDVGTVVVKATQAGDSTYGPAAPVSRNIVIKGRPQTITFDQPAPKTYGDSSFEITASTSAAGLAVALRVVSGPATLADDGRTLSITGAGNVVLQASQPGGTGTGDARYSAAPSVSRTLVIAKKTLNVLVGDATRAVGEPNPEFVVNYTGFIGSDTATAPGVITTPPTLSSKATHSSAPGSYPVAVSGGLATNYQFSSSPSAATLTVVGYGGAFETLLLDGDANPVGKLTITVPANSLNYTGSLSLAAEIAPIALRGALEPAIDFLSASHTFTRVASGERPALTVFITVSTDELTGTVDRGGTDLGILDGGVRLALPSGPLGVGAHTLALRPAHALNEDDARALPAGSGHATVTLAAKTSGLTLAGKLADGAKITASLKPAADHSYRLWAAPYSKRANSYLAGRLAFQAHPDATRFPGRVYIPAGGDSLTWQKAALPESTPTAKRDPAYRAGFGPLALPFSLDPWMAPSAATNDRQAVTLAQRLGLVETDTSDATISVAHGPDSLDLGQSADDLPTTVNLSASGKLTISATNSTRWKILSLNAKTGDFTGSFVLSDVTPPVTKSKTRTVQFSGVLRQAAESDDNLIGTGFFLLPALPGAASTEQVSGELILTAP